MAEPLSEGLRTHRLNEMLEAFSACLCVPVRLLNAQGFEVAVFGDDSGFCRRFRQCAGIFCEKIHKKASLDAIQFGGTYIFSCPANLYHITYPLVERGHFLGAILVGPFLMDRMDSTLLADAAVAHAIPMEDVMELYDAAASIPVIHPTQVRQIDTLLYHLCTGLVEGTQAQMEECRREALQQQSRINEAIQHYKSPQEEDNGYPIDKEWELLTKVKTGDVSQAKAVLNSILGYVLFSSGNNLDEMKGRAMELCTLLSRAAMEGGAQTDTVLRITNQFWVHLSLWNSSEEVAAGLQEMVSVFSQRMLRVRAGKNREWIMRAAEYVAHHYPSSITLKEVADVVHMNAAYFSTLFKQMMGVSFKEYLNKVRVEEAKSLLHTGTLSVMDIALAVGFESQSYFAKVFRRYTGFAPKEYRR